MFTNTAYEALYEYLGLGLHSKFVELITSQKVFASVIILIFAAMFFMTTIQFFSRYLPGVLIQRRMIPLSRYVKMVFFLFLGISLLKVGSTTGVKDYKGHSWHENQYVKSNDNGIKEEYRVSFLFDLLSRSAEEISSLLNRIVDELFAKTNSQLEAPNFIYKAVMLAGSSTIEDPGLRESIEFYNEECIKKVLPLVGNEDARGKVDSFFSKRSGVAAVERELSLINPSGPTSPHYTCLDAKGEVLSRLLQYTREKSPRLDFALEKFPSWANDQTFTNLAVSGYLSNLYLEKTEDSLGIQKGAEAPSGSARIYQTLNRLRSWDGFMSLFGAKNHGASMAAERSKEFSETLSRAPHVAGFIKMALIALFPWLVFLLVAGRWRILVYWYAAYLSVLLWAPIWTLLYHIMTGVTFSTEAIAAIGNLSDGVSLYSAEILTTRINYMFTVYSWLQLLVGPTFSGTFLWMLKPVLSDTRSEEAPEFMDGARSVGLMAAKGVL